MLQLRFAAHNMIERFHLPKRSGAFDSKVDHTCASTFPILENAAKSDIRRRFGDGVQVVRHDDPGIHMVFRAVSM